ncbi:glycoside hydrolase family 108 protein [Pleomorphomonas koreensis]|uniref:glycoside hydrolase family 108 protein n=1 Tax=Pleomorphomonas koreensis TaxID=257440 RepID=UPI00040745F8|nr:glycosyl hydrolase 108 family protein [Pleomorphomonas koreensis]
MDANFSNCLAVTLGYEGGWSDHPSDPGGATMKGITLATYRRFKPGATKTDLRNISNETVAKIYRTDYWDKVGGDRLAAGVDLATFDAGVNSGPGRARQWLMAAIGGPDHYTVKRVCAKRLGFMRSLAIWNTFGNGWSRRVAGIEAKGVAWALAQSTDPARARAQLTKEANAASATSKKQTAGASAAGTATTAGGSDALFNPDHVDQIAGWVLGGLLSAGALVAAVLIVRAIIHRQRAAAYAAEAERIMS